MAEIKHWQETSDPVVRLRQFMESRGWWDTAREQEMRDKERYEVLRALETAEKRPKPPLNELFTDVYREKPGHLLKQEEELLKHMEKYPEHYRESDH
jgi:2-oxoisovalerate dehydrogenase E1 component alpha subunit